MQHPPKDSAEVLGAGGYGVVVKNAAGHALKLFYDSATDPHTEAAIQTKARELLAAAGISIKVPAVYSAITRPFVWRSQQLLNGITMEAVEAPDGGPQMHILLGYGGGDLDTLWLRDSAAPAGPTNLPRGFFAGADTLTELWEERGSRWTVERAARLMGHTMAVLIAGGIVPVDLEFVYGDNDALWLIDFGLCRFGRADPRTFLEARGSEGLAGEIYIPQEGMRGRAEFLEGYVQKQI